MTQHYRQILSDLRQSFPQLVADRVGEASLVYAIQRTLDQIAAMKSAGPMHGAPAAIDFSAAHQQIIDEQPLPPEQVTKRLVEHLSGMLTWSDPRVQANVDPSPTTPSIIGGLLPLMYNPNLVSDESSRQVAAAEIEVASMAAGMVGYDREQSGGFFTFGGTGTTLYGVKLGLEKCRPGSMQQGLNGPAHIVCSEQAHHAARTVAGWLGLGIDAVVNIPADRNHEIRTCLFETICRDLYRQGDRIAAVIATVGTTDAFGVDDLHEMFEIRNRLVDEFTLDYVPHLHADAVIGWAWSVFNDYEFESNPLGFQGQTLKALAAVQRRVQHLRQMDSIGIDFHKTGFTPHVSSLFLTRDQGDLELLKHCAESTPYLFQSGHYHPGQFTLETTRAGGGPLAALANLLLFGKNGLRSLLGHLVSIAESLRGRLASHPAIHVLNSGNFGLVTLFRVYPNDVDTVRFPDREQTDPGCRDKLREYNTYNRRLFELMQAEALQGRGVVISLTDGFRRTDYGEPLVALKSCIMSPFSEEQHVADLLESLWRARDVLAQPNRP